MRKPLTGMSIAALQPRDNPYYVPDAKADGLRLRVAPTGVLTWSLVVRIAGRGVKSYSLGRCDPSGRTGLAIAPARERAATILRAARAGRDLLAEEIAAQEAAKVAMTVADLISAYGIHISSPHRKGGPLRTAAEIERRLRRALDDRLATPLDNLVRRDVSRALDAIADRFPREAEKRRQVVHAMFVWAVAKGYTEANPAAGVPGYGMGKPRDRVLSAGEIGLLWAWLDAGANAMLPDAISALRLQLLTGCRHGEAAGIEAEEVVRIGNRLLWLLPAARSKNKQDRTTPLVGRARDVVVAGLSVRPKGPLFRIGDGSRALQASDVGNFLNNRTLPIEKFTTHDLRRSAVSHMDELGISLDTIAAVIGHQRGTRATATLVRHCARAPLDDRVEAALMAWDHRIGEIVGADEAGASRSTSGTLST